MNTDLIYMRDGAKLEDSTTVLEIPDAGTLVLPETVFYPQGGGQPSDTGTIVGPSGRFRVDQVRNIEGTVHHLGEVTDGSFAPGEAVELSVDGDRRALNSRLHSAGHVVDLAAHRLGFGWRSGKGFHFPDGPYVEYAEGTEGADLEGAKALLASECDKCVAEGLPVRIEFMSREEMERSLGNVPIHIPENRPSRVVFMGDYGVPCGGTHVESLGEIGKMSIRDVKMRKGSLRISYVIS